MEWSRLLAGDRCQLVMGKGLKQLREEGESKREGERPVKKKKSDKLDI